MSIQPKVVAAILSQVISLLIKHHSDLLPYSCNRCKINVQQQQQSRGMDTKYILKSKLWFPSYVQVTSMLSTNNCQLWLSIKTSVYMMLTVFQKRNERGPAVLVSHLHDASRISKFCRQNFVSPSKTAKFMILWTCYKSLSWEKWEKENNLFSFPFFARERLVASPMILPFSNFAGIM